MRMMAAVVSVALSAGAAGPPSVRTQEVDRSAPQAAVRAPIVAEAKTSGCSSAEDCARLAEPCALVERASRRSPRDADLLADLGLCLARLGRQSDASVADLEAVRLGEVRTRKKAYANLDALGYVAPAVEMNDRNCGELVSNVPGCRKALFGCAFDWGDDYRGYTGRSGRAMRIGDALRKDLARRFEVPLGEPKFGHYAEDVDAEYEESGHFRPSYVAFGGTVDVVLEERHFIGSGAFPKQGPVAPEVVGDTSPDEFPAPVACRIVAIDACRGLIGLACVQVDASPPRRWEEEVSVPASR